MTQRSFKDWERETINQANWIYKYSIRIGPSKLEIMTDGPQHEFCGLFHLDDDNLLEIKRKSETGRWVGIDVNVTHYLPPHPSLIIVQGGIYIDKRFSRVEDLADFMVEQAEKIEKAWKAGQS